MKKAHTKFICTLFLFCLTLMPSATVKVFAHSNMLDVEYDECLPLLNGDGINEKWYVLTYNNNNQYHIPSNGNNPTIIKYCFMPSYYDDPEMNWTNCDTASINMNELKSNISQGLNQWDKVVFYKKNDANSIIKNKLVNVIESDSANSNFKIYPYHADGIADTGPVGNASLIETIDGINHNHYDIWRGRVFLNNETHTRNMHHTWAHELGHVLGLRDVENFCEDPWHHGELLMGYENEASDYITYKDLVGVAITRGYHSDSDHVWLYDSSNSSPNHYKLICSICNGIKFVNSLNNITSIEYGSCSFNHSLSSNNMMAVASYEEKDYFKCKYCRYVAPFDDIVTQNYTYTNSAGNIYHTVINNVSGLNYNFLERHTYGQHFEWVSYTSHNSYCKCERHISQPHAILENSYNQGYYLCVACGGRVRQGFTPINQTSNLISSNGSYYNNGIIILVEEDLQAYLDGALSFINSNCYES